MNHSLSQEANQDKNTLLFVDEQGRKLSFENIRNAGVAPTDLIPQSKNALIMTLLHRLEKQNEFLIEQKKTQGYLGDVTDIDELDELDELIAMMVNQVDFSKLSAAAKDKLINSLLRRVKKHHQSIENIKQRNHNERARLQAVEVDTPRDYAVDTEIEAPAAPKLDATDSDVTNAFVPMISGSIADTSPDVDFTPHYIDTPEPEALFTQHDTQSTRQLNSQPELTAEPATKATFEGNTDAYHAPAQSTLRELIETPTSASSIPVMNADRIAELTQANNERDELLSRAEPEKYTDKFEQLNEEHNKRKEEVNTPANFTLAPANESILPATKSPVSKQQGNKFTSHFPNGAVHTLHADDQNHDAFYDAHDSDYRDDVDEDEEDESQYLFDLKDHYEKDNGLINQQRTVIEVVMMRFGEVVNVEYVAAGESYRTKIAGKKYKLLQNAKNNDYSFFYDSTKLEALLIKGDNAEPVLLNTPGKVEKREIPNDGVIRLNVGNVTYLLKRVAPIASPEVTVAATTHKSLYQSLFGSAVFHFLMLLIGSLFVTLQLDITKEPEQQFVSVDIEKIQPKVIPPKPPAPVVKPKVVPPKPKPPAPKAKAKPTPTPKPKAAPKQVAKKVNSKPPASTVKVNVKKSGLLASLGSPKSKKSNSSQALSKVTNLNAVSSLNSQSAKVKVGGLSAKVANSRVSIPSGPSFDAQGSMVSGEGRGNIAALNRGDVASGDIRGKVTASLTKKAKIGGGLSREAVKKVIDANMAAVTYCYEKALVGNSNLSGKAVFEWKILQNGKVGQVGIQSSTLRSNKLHSCIKGAIKSWQFPQPKGVSSTTVSYPFIFNMVGF